MGDVNINMLNLNRSSSHLQDIFETYNLCQIVSEPTRKNNLLDILAISKAELVISSVSHIDMHELSDHQMIYCDLKIKCSKPSPKFVTYRNYKCFNSCAFTEDLEGIDWRDLYLNDDIDKKLEIFNTKVLNLFDVHAPIVTRRVSKPKAPWYTYCVRQLIHERGKLLTKYKKSRSESDWQKYQEMRNFVTEVVRREKEGYVNYIHAKKDTRLLWKTLEQLNVHNSTGNQLPQHLKDVNNINSHFINSIDQMFCKISPETEEFYLTHRLPGNPNSFNFDLVSEHMVIQAIHSMRSNATGIDGVSLQMLKQCCPAVVRHLVHVFNTCIKLNYFPVAWKIAAVIPLPKVRDPRTFNDIRSISLLCVISKVFEKILYAQINDYLIVREIYPLIQSGFRKDHSTSTALVNILDDLLKSCDEGRLSALVLLDFSKAFDLVDHRLLCAKLKYLNFSQAARALLETYLFDRKQYVLYENNKSDTLSLKKGVPQGSILGPLLFLLYIFDVSEAAKGCKIQQYADDTQLYISYDKSEITIAQEKLQNCIDDIVKYSADHGLKLNSSKTQVIFFGSQHNNPDLQLRVAVNGSSIEASREVKIWDFGWIVTYDLKSMLNV
nr:unnamed protein product [Callosobruchus analis]